jgi:hypothetical protein
MKVTVAETDIARASVQEIKVGEIKVGPVAINKLVLSNVHVQTSIGAAQLRDVRLALTLKFLLDWEVGIDVSMPHDIPSVHISRSGTIDLGSLELDVRFGDLNLPGLANLSFDIPSLPVTNLEAVAGQIKNLNLGATIAQQIQALNLVAPTQGFQISGLSLTKARAQGVALPAAVIDATTIGHLQGGSLPLTNLTVPNIALPQATIPTVTTNNVDAATNVATTALPKADAGILKVTLKVDTTAGLHIDQLLLDDIKAYAVIGELELGNVVLPYEVFDLTLSQIGIETVLVPQLEVS